jgi:hypothetical protein
MALYVSAGTRRRRAVVTAVVTGVVALALGWLVGRQQVPSIDERVASVHADANDVATGIERLDIEYEQVLTGAGDTVEAGVVAPLAGLREALIDAMDRAPWLAPSQRGALLDQLAEIESAAKRSVPLADLQALLVDAGAAVRSTFGVTG